MLKSTNKIETNKYELEVEVDAAQFENAVQSTYRRKAKNISIPGFRKGKAPRKMIEKLYGEGFFYEDAVNALVPAAVYPAVAEAGLTPVVRPDVEVTSLDKNTGVVFKMTVISKPEVEISDYMGIEIAKNVKDITDEDVDNEVNKLRERQGRLVTVEGRAAENGDTTVIDFEGFIDGKAFDGGKEDMYELKLGTGYFIPGFEDQIVGHNPGDEFTVNVTFPENYQMTDVAGKPAEFKVKLHEIKALELPEVDDEFVKDVSEFDTLDELKNDIKTKLTERAAKNADIEAENKLYDTVIEKMTAEIPNEMIEAKIDEMVRDFEYRLSTQGLNLETYLSYTGMDAEGFRKTFRDNAEKQVKLRLAFEKIAQLENVEVSDEAIEAEVQKIADAYKITPAQVKQIVTKDNIMDDLKVEAAAKLVKDSAKIA
ncbi:MAG: trigger factor [Oscillospiraceae bacterium]|nr:trigger factor [Oscillospiraceae bacterium]MDY2848501.1 trigger factor [Oscillospiraceae bacterium]